MEFKNKSFFFVSLLVITMVMDCHTGNSIGNQKFGDSPKNKLVQGLVSIDSREIRSLRDEIAKNSESKKEFNFTVSQAEKFFNDSPIPIKNLESAGLLRGDPRKEITNNAIKDFDKILVFSFVGRMNNDSKYMEKSVQFLRSWAQVNQSKGQPIDDTEMESAIIGYDLIRPNTNDSDRTIIDKWFRSVAYTQLNSEFKNKKNNWNSHRVMLIGTIGYLLNDKILESSSFDEFKKQIIQNLKRDGSSIDFEIRDALHYHCFTMEPLLRMAIVFKKAKGYDFYHDDVVENGINLKNGVDFLLPYLTGEEKHGEYVHTQQKFDVARANNHEEKFRIGRFFDPFEGAKVIALAQFFDPDLEDVFQKISSGHDKIRLITVQNLMNKAKTR